MRREHVTVVGCSALAVPSPNSCASAKQHGSHSLSHSCLRHRLSFMMLASRNTWPGFPVCASTLTLSFEPATNYHLCSTKFFPVPPIRWALAMQARLESLNLRSLANVNIAAVHKSLAQNIKFVEEGWNERSRPLHIASFSCSFSGDLVMQYACQSCQ